MRKRSVSSKVPVLIIGFATIPESVRACGCCQSFEYRLDFLALFGKRFTSVIVKVAAINSRRFVNLIKRIFRFLSLF